MKEKEIKLLANEAHVLQERLLDIEDYIWNNIKSCLLYTSPSH